MFRTFLILFLLVNISVAETPDELIKKLGDSKFSVREHASKELIKMGITAIKKVEQACSDSDIEIAYRSQMIMNVYFDVYDKSLIPEIWDISNKIRFPNGIDKKSKDIAMEYFIKARAINNHELKQKEDFIPLHDYTDRGLSQLAFKLFIFDEMYKGLDREEARYLIKTTRKLSCVGVRGESWYIEYENQRYWYPGPFVSEKDSTTAVCPDAPEG